MKRKLIWHCIFKMLWFFIFVGAYSQEKMIDSEVNEERYIRTIYTGKLPQSENNKLYHIRIADRSEYRDRLLTMGILNDSSNVVNGEFKFVFRIKHPVHITLPGVTSKDGDITWGGLLIEPGDSIYVDKEHPSAMSKADYSFYSGKGSEKLKCIQQLFRNIELYDNPSQVFINKKGIDRLNLSDSICNMIMKTLEVFRHKLSPLSVSLIKAQFIPKFSWDISSIIIKTGVDIYSAEVKRVYKDRLEKGLVYIDPSNPDLIYCFNEVPEIFIQRALLKYAMESGSDYKTVAFSTEFKMQHYKAIKESIAPSIFRDRVLSWYLEKRLAQVVLNSDLIASIRDFLDDANSSNSFRSGIRTLFDIYSNRLQAGTPAYPFELPDTVGNIVKMSDFKGKAVLIDFMFTGCIACAKMVPFLRRVEDHFKGNAYIEFISISTDSKYGWRGGSVSSVKGNKFLFTSSWKHPIIQYYNIVGYPTLVLIDRYGRLVSARAPDPRLDNGKALINLIESTIKGITYN